MSFRLFSYYCALCGGAGAFVGWALGRFLSGGNAVFTAGIKGLWLGLAVSVFLGLLDALWNLSIKQPFAILSRILVVGLVGALGGLFGGIVGGALYAVTNQNDFFLVFGWTLTGLLIGASLGVFDLVAAVMANQDIRGSVKKILNGLIGGGIGGILGGILSVFLGRTWTGLFANKDRADLWSPSSWGFVALGACIGLLIALAQIILKEAWLKVEQGFRKGREMILNKGEITIGRAEACDLGLFGDNQIEKVHARIQHRGNEHVLIDNGTPAGTYVNDQRVNGAHTLRSGDIIRLGRCVLRFGERAKQK
jgi:hypothetical protein